MHKLLIPTYITPINTYDDSFGLSDTALFQSWMQLEMFGLILLKAVYLFLFFLSQEIVSWKNIAYVWQRVVAYVDLVGYNDFPYE